MAAVDIYREALLAYLTRFNQDQQAVDQVLNQHLSDADQAPLAPPFPLVSRDVSPAKEAWAEYDAARAEAVRTGLSGRGVSMRGAGSTTTADFVTTDGYRILVNGSTVTIYTPDGRRISEISGDPHVYEGADGNADWHFAAGSTFILPDGSKVYLTTQVSSGNMTYVVGVDVQSGEQRAFVGKDKATGQQRTAQVLSDRLTWDQGNADSESEATGGVFAVRLGANMQWARLQNGRFYDVAFESWDQYLRDPDVDVTGSDVTGELTAEQLKAINERPTPTGPSKDRLDRALTNLAPYAAVTVGQLRQHKANLQSAQRGPVQAELQRLSSPGTEEGMRATKRATEVAQLPTLDQRINKIQQMAKNSFKTSWS